MREIRSIQTAHHDFSKLFDFIELKQATYVLLRNDTVRASLQPPYDERFEVKQERKLTSASRSLYTLAIIIMKFKNTTNYILNSIR